ncbi:penicillin acylase family protein [Haloparvum sedimenti]|uniref:penicillin acylase family protein n=1 Tax=Haloparvum sedimenti TaxID=1678448 RepID=UPI00071E9C0C|nr:penicillin acylase family protein [Haloparvum sedimenti]
MTDLGDGPSTTRRGLIGAIIGGTAAAGTLSPVAGYLRAFAPLSGSAWGDPPADGTVASPHGPATVRIDEEAVPHVAADDELAAAYATGYAQATHRLFQLDLQRRVMRGRLSEVVGPATLGSDEFHVRMDFVRAAEASWDRIRDTPAGDAVGAYADGVNARMKEGDLPVEFRLLDYEPVPWTPVDTMLMEKQIAWALTGSFRSLRRAALRDALGEAAVAELFPQRYDHDSPILRDAEPEGDESRRVGLRDETRPDAPPAADVDPDLASWLSGFESPPGFGSNSWVVSGAHTASGDPLLANDPHLSLQAPPVWYEQHVTTPESDVRGVTFPGVPFVVIGASDRCAWGFTNPGSDQLDCYTYETRGEVAVEDDMTDSDTVPAEYRCGDEWRAFETETATIPVAGAADRTVAVRKSVHGPVLDREGREVGIAWTGLVGSGVTTAIREFPRAETVAEIDAASRSFDSFSQCLVAADADGGTLFRVTGRVPIRETGGEPVRGDRVHDGSAREGEWPGYEPYDPDPDWSGAIPFEEMPAREDPDLLATANQRIVDDDAYPYYLAEGYSTPWRGIRVYDRLDAAVAAETPLTLGDMASVQRDVRDGRAGRLVPLVVDAVAAADGDSDPALREAAATLEDWDRRMTRDSEAALLFDRLIAAYRDRVFADRFAAAGLDEGDWPTDWVLVGLDPDGDWLGGRSRDALLRESLAVAVDRVTAEREAGEATTYGDVNSTAAIRHPFGQSFLNYPAYPTDGSPATLFNYRRESSAGSSWRMLWSPDEARAILPGGNSGRPFSNGYASQLKRWADGEYKPLRLEPTGEVQFRFAEADNA